jgi:hypothetical protein
MNLHPFNEVNDHLLKRLARRTDCIGKDYSYFKIVQHGIIYAFNGTTKKLLNTFFGLPIFVQIMRYAARGAKYFATSRRSFKEILILDPGREIVDENGQVHSFFFKKIREHLGTTLSTSICFKPESKPYSDYSLFDFPKLSFTWSAQEVARIRDINRMIQQVRKCGHYTETEIRYIESSCHVFLEQYLQYFGTFKKSGVRRIFFIAHYHNEGIIAAARDLGIETIEIQHGLINAKDLYYVYDPAFREVLKNALFPDKIYLYGAYWKQVLEKGAEWVPEQFDILGASMIGQEAPEKRIAFHQKEKRILVASQKGMADLFIPLISSLLVQMQHHPEWSVTVKLHPYELETERYYSIKHDRLEYAPLKSSIKDYLSISRIQLSIYSTTLFDAAGHDIINCIWLKSGLGNDYAQNLVENQIGIGITEGMDPIMFIENIKEPETHFLSRQHLYSVFNPVILRL